MKGEMSSEQQGKAPRRELQGPRPAPLKISRDSHKIRKPQLPLAAVQYRQPVIIYAHSPEIIHTKAPEFMTLVQRLTGRVNAHGDSTMPSSSSAYSSFQSQACHALPHSHTSVPGNPNGGQADASPSPPGGGIDFLVKEEKCVDSGSNPSEFSGHNRSQHSTVQSLLSPTTQSSSVSPLSPHFFLPSPNIFQDFPMYTPQPDYSPTHMESEPHLTPSVRPTMNGDYSLPSPSPTGFDLFNNHQNY